MSEGSLLEPPGRGPKGRRPGKKERRKGAILHALLDHSPTTVEDLADRFDVSLMTIYRDVAELEADGLISRNHGEISATASTLVESSARLRTTANVSAKRRLARSALELIPRGGSVILDDSTTNLQLFPDIGELAPLTIVTNARFIADHVAADPELTLIDTGGQYVSWANAYFGPATVRTLGMLRADVCIMSSSAVHGGVCYHPSAEVAQTKRAMLKAADRSVLLADHTKFSRSALHAVGPLTDFSTVITTAETPTETLQEMRDLGVHVLTV